MNSTVGRLFTLARHDGSAPSRRGLPHVHRFHRAGDDVFSGGSLYSCRCGVVRVGF